MKRSPPPAGAPRDRRPRARHLRPGTAVLEKGRRRSEAILDAAAALLVDEGYAALSTRKIAARAGIRLGNLQYYFPAKRDVVHALLERVLERSAGSIEARLGGAAASPRERLDAALAAILAGLGDPAACGFFVELWALAQRDPEVAAATDAFYARYRRRVAELLSAAAPALGAERAERRAELLVALLEGLAIARAERGGAPGAALRREIGVAVDALLLPAPPRRARQAGSGSSSAAKRRRRSSPSR